MASAVLSGNRNFEGRINPLVKANYLASPPLVVAYALAGTTDIDLATEPLGNGKRRQARVSEGHLADARGSRRDGRRGGAARDVPQRATTTSSTANPKWNEIADQRRRSVRLGAESTYIQEPPFLIDLAAGAGADPADHAAPACWRRWAIRSRPTTSRPAGSIAAKSPAGLLSAGARRGAGRLQQLRRAPRQRPRDDPRHVRQHPHSQPAGPGHRRGRHAAPARRRS